MKRERSQQQTLIRQVLRDYREALLAPKETVAEIEYAGSAIRLPQGMELKKAIQSLQRRLQYEEEVTEINEVVDAFPWDAAYALQQAINEQFGWSQAEWIPGGWFAPDEPPQLMSIEIGFNETVHVPWGRFTLPNIKGFIQTGHTRKGNLVVFQLTAQVLRKHEKAIKRLAERTREIVREQSIYRGKAIKVRFTDEHSRAIELPVPKFLDVSNALPSRLVFSDHVYDSIATNLYTPIERYAELPSIKAPFKRGVLLSGDYGTGKTELAFTAAHLATLAHITFLYCEVVTEFAQAIQFAQQYAPAIVFCEDIDRVSAGGERTDAVNAVLNTMDGIEAKGTQVMVVLTSNNANAIYQGMVRPGRIDAVIEVERPDPSAVQGLIRLYARDLLDPAEDLADVGELLNGQIPSVVQEVVERSKLAALRRTERGGTVRLSGPALAESARTMAKQVALLERKPTAKPSDVENAGHILGRYVADGMLVASKLLIGQERATVERVAQDGNGQPALGSGH